MLSRALRATFLAIAVVASVDADEVYEAHLKQSNERIADIVYELELETYAIWVRDDASTRYYIDGLAGVYTGRGTYKGFYVTYEDGEERCPEPRLDHNGLQAFRWGLLEIEWLNDSEFTMRLSQCGQSFDPALTIVGRW